MNTYKIVFCSGYIMDGITQEVVQTLKNNAELVQRNSPKGKNIYSWFNKDDGTIQMLRLDQIESITLEDKI